MFYFDGILPSFFSSFSLRRGKAPVPPNFFCRDGTTSLGLCRPHEVLTVTSWIPRSHCAKLLRLSCWLLSFCPNHHRYSYCYLPPLWNKRTKKTKMRRWEVFFVSTCHLCNKVMGSILGFLWKVSMYSPCVCRGSRRFLRVHPTIQKHAWKVNCKL